MPPMDGESIRVTRSVVLPLGEVELRFSRSSGPGGQHAQKSETRVEAVFDVESSEALTEAQKRRVIGRTGPGKRVPTKPTAAARERRLEGKRRRAKTKRLRRPPDD